MVLGRAGMKLEAQKFAVYLSIPIMASLAFNEPTVQQWAADYFQFMKYPSNPKTNLMKEFEQLQRERKEEIEEERRMQEKRIKGREEYLAQMKLLNSSPVRSNLFLNKLPASFPPTLPKPINPIFMSVCPVGLELLVALRDRCTGAHLKRASLFTTVYTSRQAYFHPARSKTIIAAAWLIPSSEAFNTSSLNSPNPTTADVAAMPGTAGYSLLPLANKS